MFALSFIYTKMSLNDIIPNYNLKVGPSRQPASELIDDLPKTYNQNNSIKNFYKELEKEGTQDFQSVASFDGIIVGKVNVENFGFVIGDLKKSTYQILDNSDVSEGKLYHDVMAHLVSAKSLDKKTSWLEYFEAYKVGLKGQPHNYSFYVEKGIENALIQSEKYLLDNMTHDLPLVFTNLMIDHREVNVDEKIMIETALKKRFPSVQIFE
ncbi:MAG: hypothetical protein K2Q18_09705, partial [Bdellovibrionales bacterium]|nr:hypothetical protein [Bdellovibrionales bacterium]